MPKYFKEKVAGYYLYYTKHCVIEAMHAHASEEELSERGSAKFWVKADGSSIVQDRVFFARGNSLKLQRHFPKVAAGNSSKLHLPFPYPYGYRKVLLQTYFC